MPDKQPLHICLFQCERGSGAIKLYSACMHDIGYFYAIHAEEEQGRWEDQVGKLKRCLVYIYNYMHEHTCTHIKLEMGKAYPACSVRQFRHHEESDLS